MASIGGSGSSSNNLSMSNGRFAQNVWKPQGNALTNLYNNANSLYDSTVGQMQGLIPGVNAAQNGVSNSANNAMQNLMNGGAYQGINGADVMNRISGATINPNSGQQSMVPMLGGGMNTNIMNLPGQIATSQNQMLDMLRPTANLNNDLLPNQLLNPMTGVGKMDNTSNIYNKIMNGTGNAYVGGMQDMVARNAKMGLDQSLNSIDQRAAAGGMGGSTRQGIAQGMATAAANQNAQDQMTKIGYDSFGQDLGNKLNIAQQADTNATNRYLGNLNYNQGLVNAGNVSQANAMGYNTGLGGLGNQANNQNLNYNLGYGANVNQNNQNAYNYGNNLYSAGAGLNSAIANANANTFGSALGYNGGLMSMMPGFAQGAQNSMNMGAGMAPTVQGMYGSSLNNAMAPFQALSGYADAIGGPITLGSGKYSSMGQGSSKGGGGGVSVMGG